MFYPESKLNLSKVWLAGSRYLLLLWMSLAVVVCSPCTSGSLQFFFNYPPAIKHVFFGNQRLASHLTGTIITYFNYLQLNFKCWIFHCHVWLQGGYIGYINIYIYTLNHQRSSQIFRSLALWGQNIHISPKPWGDFLPPKGMAWWWFMASWMTIWLWHSQG